MSGAPRYPFTETPVGWFTLAFSEELRPGAILERTFMGERFVLFRTAGGTAALLGAYCPHLGASFAHGGKVRGETLECPFHGFRFDVDGRCVEVPYAAGSLPKGGCRTVPLLERGGMLHAWYHPAGDPPSWHPPEHENEGWSRLYWRRYALRSHPAETTENSVDVGHFSTVHGYGGVEVLRDLEVEGPLLTAKYAMLRSAATFGRPGRKFRAEFEVEAWGLGHSIVNVEIPDHGLRTRQYVLVTPTSDGYCNAQVAVRVQLVDRPKALHPALAFAPVPRRLLQEAVGLATMHGFAHDFRQDFDIWEHKAYVSPPALAKGDGPIGPYRKWMRQFLAEAPADGAA